MEETSLSSHHNNDSNTNWIGAQELLRRKLVLEDDFTWRPPTTTTYEQEDGGGEEKLRYVGGVDLSFSKDDPSVACGALVVVDLFDSLNVVYDDFSVVHLQIPYIPGFLAFREAPVILELLDKMKHNAHPFYPQLLMVDGNGLLHPRGFGLACHLGVMANLPTIGIGKNAMRSTQGSLKPIFISIGNRISLDTAIKVVKMTCKYRVPEPIRQADMRSRDFLQKHPGINKIMQI